MTFTHFPSQKTKFGGATSGPNTSRHSPHKRLSLEARTPFFILAPNLLFLEQNEGAKTGKVFGEVATSASVTSFFVSGKGSGSRTLVGPKLTFSWAERMARKVAKSLKSGLFGLGNLLFCEREGFEKWVPEKTQNLVKT